MLETSATMVESSTNRIPLDTIKANKVPISSRSKTKLPLHKNSKKLRPGQTSSKEHFDLVWRSKKGEWETTDFQLINKLGSGGTATVYCAMEKSSGYKIALKVQPVNEDAVCELELHQSLYHVNIVNVIDSFYSYNPFGSAEYDLMPVADSPSSVLSQQEFLYIILELCEEGSLHDIIDAVDCGISEKDAASYFKNMLDALDYIHEQDIIHCDIKPANFLVHRNETKLADFGMAVSGSVKEVVGGSVQYMSPEYLMAWRHDGENFDDKVDIYSLGVVLFEMLMGYLPYDVIEDDSSPLLDSLGDEEEEDVDDATEVNNILLGMSNLDIRGHDKGGFEKDDSDTNGAFPILDLRKLNDCTSEEPFYVPPPIFIEEVSEEAQDLITRLMEPCPQKRITIAKAKKHPWLKMVEKAYVDFKS